MAETDAARLLESMGQAARQWREDPAFRAWRDGHVSLLLDGQTLFVRRGDDLADEDQLLLEWALRSGKISEADLGGGDPEDKDEGEEFHDVEGETG